MFQPPSGMPDQVGCGFMKLKILRVFLNIKWFLKNLSVGLFEAVVACICIFLMVLQKNKIKY
jgi:hypothetical protein